MPQRYEGQSGIGNGQMAGGNLQQAKGAINGGHSAMGKKPHRTSRTSFLCLPCLAPGENGIASSSNFLYIYPTKI
ncbi:MAG: hypothetical protein QM642_00085 [Edaphocola sp.]